MREDHRKIAKFYDNQYYGNITSETSPSRHLRGLSEILRISADDRVLDIACGTGEWLAVCAEKGASVSGIDISSKAIGICQQRLPAGEFLCQPAETLPYPDNSFDIITCLGSLEHFLDQNKSISEISRVAKPDARILILVPNAGFMTYRLGLYSGTQQKAARETIRSLEEWKAMLENNGLAIQSRWKDLHVIKFSWIFRKPYLLVPLRAIQAIALLIWPLEWQYQVYHECAVDKQTPQNKRTR
ncbi:class I SAM-dependent methyltransferase [Marinobacter nauticus]|uniref:class I SAM-dependent methyltransferase n=1 Tax=Marinobacter nauticus TaxID=2743 RepID=UPI001C995D57|nr:class I SAM-dependent methyltransferase [Marinobacter nauticus]MBY5937710.1 class I SAM-dependent methyltransferase [Marinobacter nauticus]MBY5954938.1 class I SAM-dependent methyltransferase [Marinobacter nauticus]MBY6008731.1 class I SAM-dependent methyltransferase [Marinobacter nauticus]